MSTNNIDDIFQQNTNICHNIGIIVDEITHRREKQITFLNEQIDKNIGLFEYRKKQEWIRIIYCMLRNGSPMYARQIALKTGLNPKIIHRYILQLENNGYIVKSFDDKNKKIIYLNLTKKAYEESIEYSHFTDNIMENIHKKALTNNEEELLYNCYNTINILTSKLNDVIDMEINNSI